MFRVVLIFGLLCFASGLWAQIDSVSEGTASFYAQKFQGRKTSSGEIFQHDKLTAAHKSLPFGTYLRITNLSNDSTVVVKVNDRLPKKSKRSVDLTLAAAKQLNFVKKGLTRVRIEVIEKPEEEASE
jgi:rare lipoprotein A